MGKANPFGIRLDEQLCKWAIEAGNLCVIYVLAFTPTQLNIIGQTVNVDPMDFHDLCKLQHNSIVIHCDSNKMDKKGEKVTPNTVLLIQQGQISVFF